MRKVVASEFVSLDGVVESPERWSIKFWNDGIAEVKNGELFSSDALLLGRVTYEGSRPAWPQRSGDDFSDRMNGVPKYVTTGTLNTAEWNNTTILSGDVADEVRKLKDQDGGDILIGGSGTLVNTLLQEGLLDGLRLLVYPVVVGGGKRLSRRAPRPT
jgi:dihydrofolate reductase